MPRDTPTPEPTATLSGTWLTPGRDDADCRYGPDVLYERAGTLAIGGGAPILGISQDGRWYQTPNPEDPSQMCWFGVAIVTVIGELSGIPRVAAPAGLVTELAILIPRGYITFVGCESPSSLWAFGEITTTGPATVTYHYEIHGRMDIISESRTAHFDRGGVHGDAYGAAPDQVTHPYDFEGAECGDYTVQLIVTSPNAMTFERDFTIPLICPQQFC